jgi:hypothetical protein
MIIAFALLLALLRWPIISVYSLNPGTSWRSETAFFAFNEYGTPLLWNLGTVSNDDDSTIYNTTIAPSILTNVSGTAIFSSSSSFAALMSNASVVAWGDPDNGGSAPAGLDNIKTIRSTDSAFAALKQDGSVIAWGEPDYGGSAPAGHSGVKAIYCNYGAFAAVKVDGTIVAWGNSKSGGNLTVPISNVDKIYSADTFFTAVQRDGRIEPEDVWPRQNFPLTETLYNVSAVHCGTYQCLAFVRNADDGTVHAHSWGSFNMSTYIPDPWEGEVHRIFTISRAFVVLDHNGTVTIIGDAEPDTPEASQDIVAVYTTDDNFVTLSSTGVAYYWDDTAPQRITGVRSIVASTEDAFLLLMDDTTPGKSLFAIGYYYAGGILPNYDFIDVVDVAASTDTFTVLQGNGMAIIWGNSRPDYELLPLENTKLIYGNNENIFSLCAVDDPDSYDCKAILYDYTCRAGTSYVAQAVPGTCFECGPGSYSSSPNATFCRLCPLGKFMPDRGATACIECKEGWYSAANRQSCIGCPVGKYNMIDGAIQQCTDCPLGKFSNSVGHADCAPCSPGRYAAKTGQGSCALCALGKYGQLEMAKNESEGCHSCLATTYTNVAGSQVCEDCPPGSECPNPGMINDDLCSPGKYALQKGSLSCTDCSAGRYQSRYGEAICEVCSPGKYGSVNGSTTESDCQSCPVGTHSGTPGSNACKPCDYHGYADVVGLSACIACSGTGMVSNSARTGCEMDPALAGPSLLETCFKKGLALGGSFFITAGFFAILCALQWRKRVYLSEPRQLQRRESNIGKARLGILKRLNELISCFSSGFSFGSEFFIIMGFSVTVPTLAIIMVSFRLLHTITAAVFITATFGPKRFRQSLDDLGITRRVGTLNVRIENEFSGENEVFVGAAMLTCLCDCSLLIFLPWRASEMFEQSRGYPILSMLRWCESIKVVQSIASAVCQLTFVLSDTDETVVMHAAASKAMIGMNIIFATSKAMYGIITLCLKDGLYRKTARKSRKPSLNDVKGEGGAEEREIEEGAQNEEGGDGDDCDVDDGGPDSRGVELTENPLHASITEGVRSSRAMTHSSPFGMNNQRESLDTVPSLPNSLGAGTTGDEKRGGAVDEEMYAALERRNKELEAEVRCLKATQAPRTEV